jgi:hypothetical protein
MLGLLNLGRVPLRFMVCGVGLVLGNLCKNHPTENIAR